MAYRNTLTAFGSVTKTLHWTVAAFFLISYCSAYYGILFTVDGTTANERVVQIHLTSGLLVAALITVRIAWRLTGTRPAPLAASPYERAAARFVHFSLYVFMIVMPITGYLGTYRDATYLGITNFGDTAAFGWLSAKLGVTWEEFEAPLDFVHRRIGGAKLLWMLIAVHVSAALYHHFYRRDGTLVRMLPGRFRRAPATRAAAATR